MRGYGIGIVLGMMAWGTSHANPIVYDTWTTNEGVSGNYILTIGESGGLFNFNLTVDPWNAEALGVFVDLGDNTVTNTLSNVSPTGEVSIFATDTSSDSCGEGCSLNGLTPTLDTPDDEREWVFRLGSQGFDRIQTFSWSTVSAGLSLDDFTVAGIRAQQLCDAGELLPDGSCGGSDKSYGTPGTPGTPPSVIPEPTTVFLMGSGLVGLGMLRRRRRSIASRV